MSEQSTPGTSPTLFLSDADVASLADWPSVVGALAAAYSCRMSEAMVPPRSMARARSSPVASEARASSRAARGSRAASASPISASSEP